MVSKKLEINDIKILKLIFIIFINSKKIFHMYRLIMRNIDLMVMKMIPYWLLKKIASIKKEYY